MMRRQGISKVNILELVCILSEMASFMITKNVLILASSLFSSLSINSSINLKFILCFFIRYFLVQACR